MKVHYIHIRARHNGIPQPTGGYTLAVYAEPIDATVIEGTTPGHTYTLNIAKCPDDRPYEGSKGASVARARLAQDTHVRLPSKAALQELCNKLAAKLATGDFQVPVNLDHVP